MQHQAPWHELVPMKYVLSSFLDAMCVCVLSAVGYFFCYGKTEEYKQFEALSTMWLLHVEILH